MALGADLFLQGSPSARVATGAGKSPDTGAGADKAENGSFAELYARERDTTPAPAAAKPAETAETAQDATDKAVREQQLLADTGKELPTELPPEDVQLESLMLFERDPGVPVDATLAEQAPDKAAQTAHDNLLAEAQAEALAVAEQAAAELQPDEPVAVAAVLTPAVQAAALPAQPSANGRASAAQAAVAEQRAATTRLASAEPALAEDSTEVADSELRLEPFTRELDASTAGRAASAAASELRTETPPGSVNPLTQAVSQANTAAAREAATVPQQPLSMSQNGWSEAVVERVMWLSSQNLKSAEIQLDPAELGRLEVRISLNQEQTQVSFASPHAGVRDALEGQLQRLRDMFNQQGMNLVDVNVSDQSLARDDRQTDERSGSRGIAAGGEEHADVDDLTVATTALDSGRGLIDFYA
ncbi:flagellar hook-length control protein FliK [Pseudomonas sp.]|uniref:flagellar hook-length control protein FliK n=1 Tax=Pseudomonas sp. TaxID=306 RepID=UPI0019E2B024|nr:flagellar hook-length control protein FliK [Pseudomonas sp.]MBF0676276.1 flagellar hook-length control protein FliK [Pseudomonas sp.]